MTFTTLTFAIFYTVVFSLYWTLRDRRAQNVLLVIASYFFYGWWDWRFCGLMIASSLVDYGVSIALSSTQREALRRPILWSALVFNVGVLCFFKYFGFFAESFAQLMNLFGMHVSPFTVNVILPIGLSFYTFQTMSYTIDVYREDLEPTRSLIEYLAYVSFFPQLVAGPIERATELLPQFQRERVFDYNRARDGMRQALWGFFKKVAIADNLAIVVDRLYENPTQENGGHLAAATIFFAFQIYCDFSAYSDIALGTARMLGIELMRNFAHPYFSQDMGEFWRRWHISLTTWFRDYVFLPMGGARVPITLCVLLTFTLSGLWHGAAWHFVAWGTLNGLLVLFVSRVLKPHNRMGVAIPGADSEGKPSLLPSPAVLGRILVTFLVICVTWIFFRAKTMGDVGVIFEKFVFERHILSKAWGLFTDNSTLSLLLVCFVVVEWVQREHPHPLVLTGVPKPLRWTVYTALIWFTFLMMPSAPSAFIYFQF